MWSGPRLSERMVQQVFRLEHAADIAETDPDPRVRALAPWLRDVAERARYVPKQYRAAKHAAVIADAIITTHQEQSA